MTTRITTQNITDATITTTDIATSVPLSVDWQAVKTADFTAVAGEGYFVNTSGGAITLTLPASPSIGDTIRVNDYASSFSTNNLNIARNGSNIDGSAANAVVNSANNTATFVYIDGTKGWKTIENSQPDGLAPTYISATGGTETNSGNYTIHVFNSSSNFVVSSIGNNAGSGDKVSYLVVGGGGGGGSANGGGGGGGGGGYRENKGPKDSYTSPFPGLATTGLSVSAQTYPITVGGGGGGGANGGSGAKGSNGSDSVFSTITSTGGGAGGGSNDTTGSTRNGNPGGSGGGEGRYGDTVGSGNTPPVSPSQGNPGGAGGAAGPTDNLGGGGGGAAATGGSAPGSAGVAGVGGAGATSNASGSSNSYSGGGGGHSEPGGGGNTANPVGGGANGGNGNDAAGSSAASNRGGGGGGGDSTGSGQGGSGGSGVVILRYKYQN